MSINLSQAHETEIKIILFFCSWLIFFLFLRLLFCYFTLFFFLILHLTPDPSPLSSYEQYGTNCPVKTNFSVILFDSTFSLLLSPAPCILPPFLSPSPPLPRVSPAPSDPQGRVLLKSNPISFSNLLFHFTCILSHCSAHLHFESFRCTHTRTHTHTHSHIFTLEELK